MKYVLRVLVVVALVAIPAEAAFNAGRLTVTTTATALYTAPARGGTVLLCNRHTTSIFLGGSAALTVANGFELLAADCMSLRPFPREAIWFIVAAATARVDYAEGMYREP